MAADRSYVTENEEQLTRLRTLVDSLSDEELAAPMEAGWTVAAVLGHLAFWEHRIVTLVDRWGPDGKGTPPDAPGSYINPLRADHRREHLDDIERSRSRR